MDVLPARIEPPTRPIQRRHAPATADYRSYRACLRWDFGFTCPFCLTHETDWAFDGVEGLGLFTIEHFVPKSVAPERIRDYTNCLYACRQCNGARWTRPNEDRSGRKLLDPSVVAWSEHFVLDSGNLRPAGEDRDARYTHEAYDLDEPRKRARRVNREIRVTQAIEALATAPTRLLKLLDLAGGMSAAKLRPVLDAAEDLRNCLRAAKKQLAAHRPVPVDAPLQCACAEPFSLTLPFFLAATISTMP